MRADPEGQFLNASEQVLFQKLVTPKQVNDHESQGMENNRAVLMNIRINNAQIQPTELINKVVLKRCMLRVRRHLIF